MTVNIIPHAEIPRRKKSRNRQNGEKLVHKKEMTDSVFDLLPDPIHPDYSLSMFDKNEPRSLINIVWKQFSEVMERARYSCPDLFRLSEGKLRKKVKPDPLLDMLRLRFWQEYDRAQQIDQRMRQADIIRGICSADWWNERMEADLDKVCWILLPMAGYITRMESSLCIALDEVEAILRLPIKTTMIDKNGNKQTIINTKLIAEKVKIWQSLDQRVKGAVVQKLAVHQKIDQQITTQSNPSLPYSPMNLDDIEAIDQMIKKKKEQIAQAQSREIILLPEVKTAEQIPHLSPPEK